LTLINKHVIKAFTSNNMGSSVSKEFKYEEIAKSFDVISTKMLQCLILDYIGASASYFWFEIYKGSISTSLLFKSKLEKLRLDIGESGDIQTLDWLIYSKKRILPCFLEIQKIWIYASAHDRFELCKHITYNHHHQVEFIPIQIHWDTALVNFSRKLNLDAMKWCKANGSKSVWQAYCEIFDESPWNLPYNIVRHRKPRPEKMEIFKFCCEWIDNITPNKAKEYYIQEQNIYL
jgi:hypothetical protein